MVRSLISYVGIICVSLTLAPTNLALAKDDIHTALLECAKATSALVRLDCFDKLAEGARANNTSDTNDNPTPAPAGGVIAAKPTPSQSEEPDKPAVRSFVASDGALRTITSAGIWEIREWKDPLHDTPSVVLTTESSVKNKNGDEVKLLIRCTNNSTEAYIIWGSYLGSQESIPVVIRIGEQKAQTQYMSKSTDSKATFISNPINFIKSIMKEEKFAVQVTPYSEPPLTVLFHTKGISNIIHKVQSACRWS